MKYDPFHWIVNNDLRKQTLRRIQPILADWQKLEDQYVMNMYINTYNFTGNWQESDMCPPPPPPHLVITPRTRDFSPVLLTILIEYNSAFKNIDPPHLPRPSENNDIRSF